MSRRATLVALLTGALAFYGFSFAALPAAAQTAPRCYGESATIVGTPDKMLTAPSVGAAESEPGLP